MLAGPPEAWCWQILRKLQWSAGVFCPRCGGKARRHYRRRYGSYYWCRGCHRMFSDLTATLFEQTRAPLSAWFVAISLLSPDSEEVPTCFELARILRVDFHTAYRIRIRLLAVQEDPLICSIRTDMFLWKVKNQVRKENHSSCTFGSILQ